MANTAQDSLTDSPRLIGFAIAFSNKLMRECMSFLNVSRLFDSRLLIVGGWNFRVCIKDVMD